MEMTAVETKDLSIVIPALNEAESLPELVSSIRNHVPAGISYEVIIIDDGSTDNTEEVVRTLAAEDPNIHFISFLRNFGKAAALEAGFNNSAGDIIISMDGDMQDDPVDIPRFLEKLDKGYDLVCGWKTERKDPLEKRLPSRLFNAVVSHMSGVPIHDMNCGFKAYRRRTADLIDLYGELHRFIPCLAARQGFRIAEIPVHHNKRRFGKSKYSWERYMHGLMDAVTIFLLMRFGEQPMYLFGRLGLHSVFIGMVICLYLIILLAMGNPFHLPLLILSVLLVTAGIQFFSLGFLGDLFVKHTHRRDNIESRIRTRF